MKLLQKLSPNEIITILRAERSALGMINPEDNKEYLVWKLPANLLCKGWKLTSKYKFLSDHVFVTDANNNPIRRINFDTTIRDKWGKPVDITPEIKPKTKDLSQNMAQARLADQTKHKQKAKKKQTKSQKLRSATARSARNTGVKFLDLI